jgi:ParB family chromosome partitioning protein
MKRKGLNRGLGVGALIPTDTLLDESGLRTVPISSIEPNPHQPRSQMDEEKLSELADSIKEHGLIQPLIVTESDGKYTLIAGERRWRAAQLAGKVEVPVIVKEATPQEMLELALIENIQRADLNALEEALAYQQLMEEFGMTQEMVAQRVGKGRSTVANLVRLLTLPTEVQQAVMDGRLSGAHARNLASLPTSEMQTAVMKQIVKLGFNVRQTEQLVQKLLGNKKPPPKQRAAPEAELAALEMKFRESLGTRVDLKNGRQGGRVIIHFYSDEELQAIYEVIVGDEDDS